MSRLLPKTRNWCIFKNPNKIATLILDYLYLQNCPTFIINKQMHSFYSWNITNLTVFICLSVFFLFTVGHHFATSRRFPGGYWNEKEKKNYALKWCLNTHTSSTFCQAQFAPIKPEIFNLEQASRLLPKKFPRNIYLPVNFGFLALLELPDMKPVFFWAPNTQWGLNIWVLPLSARFLGKYRGFEWHFPYLTYHRH